MAEPAELSSGERGLTAERLSKTAHVLAPGATKEQIKGPEVVEVLAVDADAAKTHASAADDEVLHAAGEEPASAAAASVATPAAAIQEDAVSTLHGRAGADTGRREDGVMFAVEDGVPKDAAVRISADILAFAATAAADGEDDEAVECTVMKRGNYWPHFWAQRLLIVERRSLLYFAGPLPTNGATPRGFFPLQQNTRILLSFDRVSLYGRTDGLLVGIFNTCSSAPVTGQPWCGVSVAYPTLNTSAARELLSPGSRGVDGTPMRLLVSQQQGQHQRLGVVSSGEQKRGDGGFLRHSFQFASPHENAESLSHSVRPVVAPTLFPPLSLFLTPFRWMFPWNSSSGVTGDQSSVREATAQNLHAALSEMTAASPGLVPSSTTTVGALTKCFQPSSFSRCASSSVPGLCSSSSTSSSSVLSPAASPCLARPSSPSASTSSRASSRKNYLSSSTDTGSSACVSAESGLTLLSASVCDRRNEVPFTSDSPQFLRPGSVYSDFEDDPPSFVPFASSAAASSPATAALSSSCSVACTDAAPDGGPRSSSGSFVSLPSTPSLPLRSCSCFSSHSTASLVTSPCPSNSGPTVSINESSTSISPSFLHQSSASSSLPPFYSTSQSPSSSSSSSSSAPPTVTSSSGFWATATYPPVSKLAFTVLSPSSASSSPTPLRSGPRVFQASEEISSTSDTLSSSSSLLSHSFLSCSLFASPSVGLSRTTSSEKSEALRSEKQTVNKETQQEGLAREKKKVQREQRRVRDDSDHVQIQREFQQLEQGNRQHQAEEHFRGQDDVPSDARTSLDCCLTSPVVKAAPSERILRATQRGTGNKSRNVSSGVSASCSDRVSVKRGDDTQTRAPVATGACEPPVLLICTGDTFAREFNGAAKPKFLFEFADHQQQYRVSCAIARSVLRIRRQARRKHEQQKQQLQDRLAQGLLKWQQEHPGSRHYRPLHVAELSQRLPRQSEELQDKFYSQEQKLMRCSQQQPERYFGLEQLQTDEMTAEHTSCVCEQKMISTERQPSPDLGRTTSAAVGRISFSSASTAAHMGGEGCAAATAGGTDDCPYLPRLLRGSTAADVQRDTHRKKPEVSLARSTARSATATAPDRSVRGKTGSSVTILQGRPTEGSGRLEPCYQRSSDHFPAGKRNVRGSEKNYLRKYTCRPFFLRDTTTDTSAGGRCYSGDSAGVHTTQHRLRGNVTDTEEAPTARTVHAAAVFGKGVIQTGRRRSLSGPGQKKTWQSVSRYSTTPNLRPRTSCAAWWLHEAAERTFGEKHPCRSFSSPALSTHARQNETVHLQRQQQHRRQVGLFHRACPFSTGPCDIIQQHEPPLAASQQSFHCAARHNVTRQLDRQLCAVSSSVCALAEEARGDEPQQQLHRDATSTSSRPICVGHKRRPWSREIMEGNSSSDAHERAGLVEIVTDLLEVLESPEGMRRAGRLCPDDELAVARCLVERENRSGEHRGQRDVGTFQLREIERKENKRKEHKRYACGIPVETEQQQFCTILTPSQQHKANVIQQASHQPWSREVLQASRPNVLEGGHQGEEKSLQEYEQNYVRPVRALVAVRRSVSRDRVEPLQPRGEQPLFQVNPAVYCRGDSKENLLHARTVNYFKSQRSVSKAILQEVSDALLHVAQNFARQKSECNCDRGNGGGGLPARRRSAFRKRAVPAGSELYDKGNFSARGVARTVCAADGTGKATGSRGSPPRQTAAFAVVPPEQHQTPLADSVKQTGQDLCGFSDQSLRHAGDASCPQTHQPGGESTSWPMQQRVRAVDMLLLEQREQLERLQSVVNFLMREREMQIRSGCQVDDAQLQQHWEEERRRLEAKVIQRSSVAAACTAHSELNACEDPDKHRRVCEDVIDEQQKGLADTHTEEQLWGLSSKGEAAMEEPHFGNVGNGEATSAGQVQAVAEIRQNRKWCKYSDNPHVVSWNSPLAKAEVKRDDTPSSGEKVGEGGVQGEGDTDSGFSAEGEFLAGGSPKATCVDGESFLDKERSGTKDDISVITALSHEERKLRNVESDAEDQEKQRKKHFLTPRELPVIFRISTPPASSGESDVDETNFRPDCVERAKTVMVTAPEQLGEKWINNISGGGGRRVRADGEQRF